MTDLHKNMYRMLYGLLGKHGSDLTEALIEIDRISPHSLGTSVNRIVGAIRLAAGEVSVAN